jgi:hypothetical protein
MTTEDLTQIPLTRGKVLAAKMFKAFKRDEDILDVCTAIAMLTVGVLHQKTKDAEGGRTMLEVIRRLEDDFLQKPWPVEKKDMH